MTRKNIVWFELKTQKSHHYIDFDYIYLFLKQLTKYIFDQKLYLDWQNLTRKLSQ